MTLDIPAPYRPPGSSDEMPQEHQKLLERIKKRVEQEMEPLHARYRDHWDTLNGLYFNYDQLRSKWREARSDKDETFARGMLLDARRDWGGHLVIPYAFATVETVVPRVIAQRPKFVAKALAAEAEEKKDLIRDAINQQLSDIDLELRLNPIARRAVKLGLGVGFTYWSEKKRKVVRWAQTEGGEMEPVETEVVDRKGPMMEDVDIYDWLWDPTAKSVETCQDICYRTWRSLSYIKQKVESKEWFPIDLDRVKNMGSAERRNQLWKGRHEAQGVATSTDLKEGHIHEVWQYFTRDRIVTILNRELVVQNDVSPFFHREFPFQVYRPTPVEGQLPGMGVIDAMTDLIAELSTMRTQRRDAATYRLNPPTFYSRGMIERRHMKTGPGVWVPVTGDIREAVWQPVMSDLPSSSYAEEDRLKQDLEMTSGVSDPVAGGAGSGSTAGTETATGIQLIQAAANVRIALMAQLMLLETLTPFGRQVLELNRQHQIEPIPMRVDDVNAPEGYRFAEVTPEDWDLPLEIVPEEHSNEPENKVEKIQESTSLNQSLASEPTIKPQARLKHVLRAHGISNPDEWFVGMVQLDPEMARVVGESFKGTLVGSGVVDDEQAELIVEEAMRAAMAQTGVTPQPGQENGAGPAPVEQEMT